MKVLVTGKDGFIASNLIKKLGDFEVFGFDRVDYFNGNWLKLKENHYDVIFHLAAIARTVDCTEDPLGDTYESNVELTRLLLRDFKYKKFIFTSSCAVYGDKECVMNEEHPIKVPSVYASQKFFSEQMVHRVCSINRVPSVCLRLFNTYGPGQSKLGGYPNVVASLVKRIQETGVAEVTGDGTQTRNFVYIDDTVEAILSCLKVDSGNHILNLGSEWDIDIKSLARMLTKEIVHTPKRDFDIYEQNSVDSRKLLELTGWKAKIPLEEGIRRVKVFESLR